MPEKYLEDCAAIRERIQGEQKKGGVLRGKSRGVRNKRRKG
jgi:hypothetical protein